VFVPGKLFKPILTNTLAYYENSYNTDKKAFKTFGPGACTIGALWVCNVQTQ